MKNVIKFLSNKYNSKDIKLVENIDDKIAGFCNGIKFDTKNNHLTIELKEDVYYLLEDKKSNLFKVIYRNSNLFLQALNGTKSNYFKITKKDCINLLSEMTLSKKKLILNGIGFSAK